MHIFNIAIATYVYIATFWVASELVFYCAHEFMYIANKCHKMFTGLYQLKLILRGVLRRIKFGSPFGLIWKKWLPNFMHLNTPLKISFS